MKKLILPLLFLTCISGKCKKDKSECWIAFDPVYGGDAYDGTKVCNKTKAEAEALYPNYWFYSSNEPKYCFRLVNRGSVTYAGETAISMGDKLWTPLGVTYTIIDCSFCHWQLIEKRKSKITGFYNGNPRIIYETYFTDTCTKLTVGKIVNYIETTDSLITREYKTKYH
ncbi:MAG: hypothetical protein ABL929_07365 [Ferruginibacter sp.]|nr:hypothetical protein [Ferruginibacter sp.]